MNNVNKCNFIRMSSTLEIETFTNIKIGYFFLPIIEAHQMLNRVVRFQANLLWVRQRLIIINEFHNYP